MERQLLDGTTSHGNKLLRLIRIVLAFVKRGLFYLLAGIDATIWAQCYKTFYVRNL